MLPRELQIISDSFHLIEQEVVWNQTLSLTDETQKLAQFFFYNHTILEDKIFNKISAEYEDFMRRESFELRKYCKNRNKVDYSQLSVPVNEMNKQLKELFYKFLGIVNEFS